MHDPISDADAKRILRRIQRKTKRMQKNEPVVFAAMNKVVSKYIDTAGPDMGVIWNLILEHFDEDMAEELKKN